MRKKIENGKLLKYYLITYCISFRTLNNNRYE